MDHRAPDRQLRRRLRVLTQGTLDTGIVATVVCGMVATVEGGTVVAGSDVDEVGGSVVGGSVVGGEVVAGGGAGAVVAGAAVPVLRGAVVTTGGWVITAPKLPAAVVEVASTVDDVEDVEAFDVVVAASVLVVVARAVVDGAWLATFCLGDVSPPVATSNNRATRAIDARAYSPTLKR